ncbi:MAG TPA: hypothetical protein VFS67_26875 [Polyangiaceae bacterium]|nr:hypothetical protein [Polyangiaceae bacterium]
MQDKTIRALGSWLRGVSARPEPIGMTLAAALALVSVGSMAACAGTDTPETDAEFRDQLAAQYGGGRVGTGGSSTGAGGGSGAGGSGATGSGGSATGAGGGAMAGAAGGSTVGGTGGGSSSAACDGFAIISMKCGMSNCHGAPQSQGLTNFAYDEATAKALVGEQDQSPLCADGGIIFNPDNAGASLVVQKMRGTASCGGQMPLGSPPLDDATIQCVEDWIESL